MNHDRWDSLLERDWSAEWERLPEAPELVPRPMTAQITLRLPDGLLVRIKRVAAARSLPYHAMARSWIVDGIRQSVAPNPSAASEEPQTEQLNLKLDNEVLDALKARADELRRPYHSLAREWIEVAIAREEEALGLDPVEAGQPAIKDLMVLLLHANNEQGQNAIRGITRLQKLLFVIEQNLASQSRFYAFNYGPFNEEVKDAANALRLAGFLRGASSASAEPPTFEAMMATVFQRSGPHEEPATEDFALNEEGHHAAERLRQSSRAYDQLYAYIQRLRSEWDKPNLLRRVYKTWPKYAERSLIRDKVEGRARRRRSN
jgi:predicted DNA binding CopG/RHH family protein